MTPIPADAITAPTPPAFPEWLKRMFPTLRAEETNMLFQAFRERRLRASWWRKATPTTALFGRRNLAILGICVVLAFTSFLPQQIPVVGYIFIIFVGLQLGKAWDRFGSPQSRPAPPSTLPYNIHEIFGGPPYADAAALDLWLAGTKPRDIVEAMYLERYAEQWRGTCILCVGSLIVVMAFIGRESDSTALWQSIALVCFAIAWYFGWRVALLNLHKAIFRSILDPNNPRWTRPYFQNEVPIDVDLARAMTKDLAGRMKHWVRSLLVITLLLFLVYPAVILYYVFLRPSITWRELIGIDLTLLQLACPISLAIAAFCHFVFQRGRARISIDFDFLAENVVEPYNTFMTSIAEHASSSSAGNHS